MCRGSKRSNSESNSKYLRLACLLETSPMVVQCRPMYANVRMSESVRLSHASNFVVFVSAEPSMGRVQLCSMTPSSLMNSFMRACSKQFASSHVVPSTRPVLRRMFSSWPRRRSQHLTESGSNVDNCALVELCAGATVVRTYR